MNGGRSMAGVVSSDTPGQLSMIRLGMIRLGMIKFGKIKFGKII